MENRIPVATHYFVERKGQPYINQKYLEDFGQS